MLTKVKSDYLIGLSEAKAHLRVDTTDEDGYILQLIKAAVQYAEQYIGKDIATTTNTLVLKDFSGSVIEVDDGNLVSVTSLKDEAGASISYSIDEVFDTYFIIETTNSVPEQDVTLIYVSGYSSATLPPSIRQAIYIKLADLYDVDRNSYGFQNYQKNVASSAFESLLNYYMAQRVKYIKQ